LSKVAGSEISGLKAEVAEPAGATEAVTRQASRTANSVSCHSARASDAVATEHAADAGVIEAAAKVSPFPTTDSVKSAHSKTAADSPQTTTMETPEAAPAKVMASPKTSADTAKTVAAAEPASICEGDRCCNNQQCKK